MDIKLKKMSVNYPLTDEDVIITHIIAESDKDGKLCGYVKVTLKPSESHALISELMVRDDKRRQGIGSVLLRIAEDHIENELRRPVSVLFCDKDSFVKRWYTAKGYDFIAEDEKNPSNHWLKKELV